MLKILLVGLGGAFGSIARYLVSGWVQTVAKNVTFPFGTLTVNLFGCFVIGFLAHLAETRGIFTPEARALVFIGVLGGFTTSPPSATRRSTWPAVGNCGTRWRTSARMWRLACSRFGWAVA